MTELLNCMTFLCSVLGDVLKNSQVTISRTGSKIIKVANILDVSKKHRFMFQELADPALLGSQVSGVATSEFLVYQYLH